MLYSLNYVVQLDNIDKDNLYDIIDQICFSVFSEEQFSNFDFKDLSILSLIITKNPKFSQEIMFEKSIVILKEIYKKMLHRK